MGQIHIVAIDLVLIMLLHAEVTIDAVLLLDGALGTALAKILAQLVLVAAELAFLPVVRVRVLAQMRLVRLHAPVARRLGQRGLIDWGREGESENGEEGELAELHDE